MISYDEAVRLIAGSVSPLPARTVPVGEAFAATAAQDLRSGADVPSFANAAMDGYALASAATAQASARAPLALEIAGHITAGEPPPTPLRPACAWEIMTGAPMPAGCDAVLPVERARLRPATPGLPAALLVEEPLNAGRNRREAGSDIAVGDLLLRAGQRIDAVAMMALAAAGFDALPVRPRPRIAVLTTGSELADTGLPDTAGIIRDANGPYLDAVLASLQLAPARRRSVSDDAGRVARELAGLAQDSDLIITTGGVSAGRYDFLPATITELGGEILFHKVAIRPGKPLLLARLPGDTLLVGLPGNPMAVAVGLRFFVLPAIRALLGSAPETYLPARSLEAIERRPSITFFAKAIATIDAEARIGVRLLAGQESFRIRPLLQANCWAIVPPGTGAIAAGDIIRVAPLLPQDYPACSS